MRNSVTASIGIGLFVMALSALVAASAPAAEWLCNGAAITTPCKVTFENLEVFVREDMGIPFSIECAPGGMTGTGTVGPGVANEITTIGLSTCKPAAKAENLKGELVPNACQSILSVSGINLPWKAEGVSEAAGAEKWDLLLSGTGGNAPGYLVECKTVLGNVDDICSQNEPTTGLLVELKNLPAEGAELGLVTELFLKNPLESSQATKCSIGGVEAGLVIGEVLLAALSAVGAPVSLEFDTP